jgi:hypothetical protein
MIETLTWRAPTGVLTTNGTTIDGRMAGRRRRRSIAVDVNR